MVFLSSFLSYGLLMLIFMAVAGCAVFLGITLRKQKNAKEAACQDQQDKN